MSIARLGHAAVVVAGLLLAACVATPAPTPSPPATPTPVSGPQVEPSPIASSAPTPQPATPQSAPTPVPAADILLQLQWGRTRPEAYVRWGRVPEFALQANGNVFYVDEGDSARSNHPQLMVAHLTEAEVEELVQQVQDLGLERLESYTGECRLAADGSTECAEGAAYSILELSQMPEAWIQLCNVADFANDPQALQAIRNVLQDYRRSDARLYIPERAAVFIQRATASPTATPLEWPLDPAWLAPPGVTEEIEWAKVLTGTELQLLLAVVGRNMGDLTLRQGDDIYKLYLVPWLPGVDLADLVARYTRTLPQPVVPGATPVPTPVPPCRRGGKGTSRLVVEEHPLKVGPMIPQVEGPYFETADGDTAEILAKNECYRSGGAVSDFFSGSVGDQPLAFWQSGDLGDELRVTLGNRLVVDVLTRPCALTDPRGSWQFEGHWVIELGLPDQDSWFPTNGQIIQDGLDLNAACGYEESYNFTLLGDKPFYFFQREDGPGIFYDGHEVELPYDEIPHYLCCSAAAMNPETFPHMVRFFGRRGEQWYYVEAYVPIDEALKAVFCPPTPTPTPTLTPVPTPPDNPETPAAGAARSREADGMVMVYVPAGGFTMGSPPGEPWDQGESPQRTVYLDAFWVDQTEVTNAQYERCAQAGSCRVTPDMTSYDPQARPDYPAEVTWSAAQAYCQWAGSRLPTEAEWEKAVRGTDGRRWPWGNDRPDCSLSNSFGKDGLCAGATACVGSYPAGASPYGALDMAGNVAEWVNDWYDYGYYDVSPPHNPPGPEAGTARVVRGGNWEAIPDWVRCAWRDGREPEEFAFGFRCVSSATLTR